MSYTSITFICFLLVTGIAYFLVPRRVQWGVLLAASLGFYVLSCGAPDIAFSCCMRNLVRRRSPDRTPD